MRDEKGFSLMQIVMSVIILLILATVVGLFVLGYMKDARLASMKEDSSAIQEAIQVEYGKVGELPVGELVELGDRNKEIISEVSGGVCGTNMKGSVMVKDEHIIEKDGKVYSGSFSVDRSGIDSSGETGIVAYEIDDEKTGKFIRNKEGIKKYVVLDCNSESVGSGYVTCEEGRVNGYECISSIEELKNIEMDGKYILVSDLNYQNEGDWESLGTDVNPFKGVIDGNGYVIKGYEDDSGLFARSENANFVNINIEDAVIDGEGVVGMMVESASGTTVKNSKFTGLVNGKKPGVGDFAVGSVVGKSNNSTFENLFYSGTVISLDYGGSFGSVAGTSDSDEFNDIKVESSVESKGHSGGIVGKSEDSVYGNIEIYGDSLGGFSGGLLGSSYGDVLNDVKGVRVAMTSNGFVGGLFGNSSLTKINNVEMELLVKGSGAGPFVGSLSGSSQASEFKDMVLDLTVGFEEGVNYKGFSSSYGDDVFERLDITVNGQVGYENAWENLSLLQHSEPEDVVYRDIRFNSGENVDISNTYLFKNKYGNTNTEEIYVDGELR